MKRTIQFRCIHCNAISKTHTFWQDDDTRLCISCGACGVQYQLDPQRNRYHSDEAYRQFVQNYARQKNIDLATAYSVVENIMTLEDAQAFVHKPAEEKPERVRWEFAVGTTVLITALALTCYGWIIWGHGETASTKPLGTTQTEPVSSPESPSTARLARLPVQLRFNDAGRLVRVAAPDPGRLLLAYCQSEGDQPSCVPLGHAQAPLPAIHARLGYFQDPDDLSRVWAIRMLRPAWSSRWMIGDGTRAIVAEDVTKTGIPQNLAPVPKAGIEVVREFTGKDPSNL